MVYTDNTWFGKISFKIILFAVFISFLSWFNLSAICKKSELKVGVAKLWCFHNITTTTLFNRAAVGFNGDRTKSFFLRCISVSTYLLGPYWCTCTPELHTYMKRQVRWRLREEVGKWAVYGVGGWWRPLVSVSHGQLISAATCAATQTVICKTVRRTTSCRDATASNAIAHNSLTERPRRVRGRTTWKRRGRQSAHGGEGKGDEQWTTGAGGSVAAVCRGNLRGGRYSQATNKKQTNCNVRSWRNTDETVWFSMWK